MFLLYSSTFCLLIPLWVKVPRYLIRLEAAIVRRAMAMKPVRLGWLLVPSLSLSLSSSAGQLDLEHEFDSYLEAGDMSLQATL